MTVQRFNSHFAGMLPDPEGGYVRFDDYEKARDAFNELRGHIQAMRGRSQQYQEEMEAEHDADAAHVHARVGGVLKELDRLAGCIAERQTPTPPAPGSDKSS